MSNQSDDSGVEKSETCGPLIDFEDDSPIVNETHAARHSTPIKYNVLEMTPCSPAETQELMASISELKTMVIGVGKQNKGVEEQFQQLAARLDMVDSRISAIESSPSRSLLNETTAENKKTTNVHLKDPTRNSGTGAECLQTSATGRTGASGLTLPRAPCLQPTKLEPSPAQQGSQGSPVSLTQPDKPKIRPAMFNGNTSWEDYLAQFELIAEINRWNDSMKATYLAVSLTGPAQAVLGDLEPTARKNFAELIKALAARFGTENQQQVYRTALKTRSRQGGETLPELAQSVRRLTRQAYPEAPPQLRESLARDHFIDALSDVDMRWRVHQSWPQTLNDALTIAVELEAFLSTNRQQNRPARAVIPSDNDVSSHGEHQGTAGTKGDKSSKELQEIKAMLQTILTDRSRPYGKYTGCHICGDKSHFQRDCPQGGAAGGKAPGNGSQPSSRG